MPRSSGTYSAPAGQPVVNGDIIDATVHNNLITDIGNEITNSIPRDGTAPPTANLPMGNFKITGLANGTASSDAAAFGQIAAYLPLAGGSLTGAIETKRATVSATATTTPLWTTSNSNVQDWTGTPTITALPSAPQAGSQRIVYPAAGTIFTDNANIDVQGNANYTVVAGDKITIEALTTTTFKVWINKKNGTALASETGLKNLIINGGFTINNGNAGTPYVSAAVLAAGTYGHEMWKAGASGGDYSFTQLASNTQITIAANKTLIQVIEDKNVAATSYVLSWEGTAQARYAVNSATPAGAYASSPILITGQTAGTTMSVEFNAGTLGKVQLEEGAIATKFETRPYPVELALTQRYAEFIAAIDLRGYHVGANQIAQVVQYIKKRASPTITLSNITNVGNATNLVVNNSDASKANIGVTITATGGGQVTYDLFATARL